MSPVPSTHVNGTLTRNWSSGKRWHSSRSVRGRVVNGPPSTTVDCTSRTDVRQESDWVVDVIDKILGYRDLHDDWDSYGGGPADARVVDQALKFALRMAVEGFSRPMVGPMSSGGIGFEWQGHGCYLTVGIEPVDTDSDFSYEHADGREIEGSVADLFLMLDDFATL